MSNFVSGSRRKEAPGVRPDDGGAAEAACINILNGAAQSARSLEMRLRRRGFDEETSQHAVAEMSRMGFVDDTRLAQSVANRRQREGYGKARIVADLRRRSVDGEAINEVVAGLDTDDDPQRALDVARRAYRSGVAPDKERRRIAGMLQRRGFSGQIISGVLRTLGAEQD